jgi:hypothetical protein
LNQVAVIVVDNCVVALFGRGDGWQSDWVSNRLKCMSCEKVVNPMKIVCDENWCSDAV